MIPDETLITWIEWARRDDWHMLFVGSDIRQMLGDIARLKAQLRERDVPVEQQT